MTNRQFSDEFDVLLNSYSNEAPYGNEDSPIDYSCDEYEKSVFLTKFQKEFVVAYCTGQVQGLSFEEKEQVREAFDVLVKTESIPLSASSTTPKTQLPNCDSVFFSIPEDLLYIIFEKIEFSDYLCSNVKRQALVVPVTHDDLWYISQNPFKGPNSHRALRLNAEDNIVEIIYKKNYHIGSYLLRYVVQPDPIILIDLPDGLKIDGKSGETECKLPEILHHTILEGAVKMAIQSKALGRQQVTPKSESKS